MLMSEIIAKVKAFCGGIDMFTGMPIEEATTRDKVTYGEVDRECTGIVTCIWPTADVIRRAAELGANLIICHEALFWNHGDHQDVIAGNRTYLAKRRLLDEWGGAVWRCHDYIHSRVPIGPGGAMVDGIFYGFAWKMGWLDCLRENGRMTLDFEIDPTRADELAASVVERLRLNGVRITGDPATIVRRAHVPMHVLGTSDDTDAIAYVDEQGVDCLLTMEFVDFTTCEYIRDAAMLGQHKCAITVGHFNLEEPGMEYMTRWLPEALGTDEVPASFVPIGDTYRYVVAKR